MALTRQEIAHRASRVRSANARRRRWQKVVAEMRAGGLDVLVFPQGEREEHPDYTIYAVPAARL
jgi:hypothetical protein